MLWYDENIDGKEEASVKNKLKVIIEVNLE